MPFQYLDSGLHLLLASFKQFWTIIVSNISSVSLFPVLHVIPSLLVFHFHCFLSDPLKYFLISLLFS